MDGPSLASWFGTIVGVGLILYGLYGLLRDVRRVHKNRDEIRAAASCGSFEYKEKVRPANPVTNTPQYTWYYKAEYEPGSKELDDSVKEVLDLLRKAQNKETKGNNVSDGQPNPVEVST